MYGGAIRPTTRIKFWSFVKLILSRVGRCNVDQHDWFSRGLLSMPMTMADNDNNENDDDDANDDRDDDEPPSTKLTWRRAIFHVDVWLAPPMLTSRLSEKGLRAKRTNHDQGKNTTNTINIEGAIRPTTIIKNWNFVKLILSRVVVSCIVCHL